MSSDLTLSALAPEITRQSELATQAAAKTFVGIDFGTSTTVASFAALQPTKRPPIEVSPIPVSQILKDGRQSEHHLVPTVIARYRDRTLVGQGGHELKGALTKGRDIWFSFKMDLGVDLGPQYYSSVLDEIRNPKDAAIYFFTYLREHIEAFVRAKGLPQSIAYSVSIPASFEANQRQDLIDALRVAGIPLTENALIDEPNAAFISYLFECSMGEMTPQVIPNDRSFRILVFDFGAGTCDISILEIQRHDNTFSSRNLAISKFERLGGDDIDRRIAVDVLLPQMLEESKVDEEYFRQADLNKGVIPKLLGAAEELKIRLCRSVARNVSVPGSLPALANSEKVLQLSKTISLTLGNKNLVLTDPALSYAQFAEVMDDFLHESELGLETDVVSIFSPISSALTKAGLESNDIDLVLLIGGSSENPYVQAALHKFFSDVEVETPRDLRAHVSVGAALNSLILNGWGHSLIRPILSESIYLTTKGSPVCIVAAGTELPTQTLNIDNLSLDANQKVVELPLYVTNENKLLTVIRVAPKSGSEFRKGAQVQLACSVTADKILKVTASVDGVQSAPSLLNPYANKELTYEERMVLEAERSANESAKNNGGRPTIEALKHLADTCETAGDYLRAAETLEIIASLNPNHEHYTQIVYYYSKAGKSRRAREWGGKAYAKHRTAVNAFNLALMMMEEGNTSEYERLMRESVSLDSNAFYTLDAFGRHLMKRGDMAEGRSMVSRAVALMLSMLERDGLIIDDCQRLINSAEAIGDTTTANRARAAKAELERKNPWFDFENLVTQSNVLAKRN